MNKKKCSNKSNTILLFTAKLLTSLGCVGRRVSEKHCTSLYVSVNKIAPMNSGDNCDSRKKTVFLI